jgi:hypothetical protein
MIIIDYSYIDIYIDDLTSMKNMEIPLFWSISILFNNILIGNNSDYGVLKSLKNINLF